MFGYTIDGHEPPPPIPDHLRDEYDRTIRELVGGDWHRYETDVAYCRSIRLTARALIGVPTS